MEAEPVFSCEWSINRHGLQCLHLSSIRCRIVRYDGTSMDRPPHIPVEPAFDEFVALFGGSKVAHLIAERPEFKGSSPLNADYLFRSENIIAELKCLEENTYSGKEFKELFGSLISDWQDRGMLPLRLYGGPILIQSRDLPYSCQLELERLINPRLRKVITKANKQIRLTKETLGLPDAKGLLLLVSNGNYFLRPEHVLGFAGRVLRDRFSNINSLIYFTVNSAVDMPTLDRDGLIWIQSFRDNFEPVSAEFLSRLREGWFQFLSNRLGIDIPEYHINDETLIEKMRFIREVEVPEVRGVGWTRCSAKHEFNDVYRLIGPITGPNGSEWQFSTGDLVRCREKRNSHGTAVLQAFEKTAIGTTFALRPDSQ